MQRVLVLAANDLRRRRRHPWPALLLVAFPLLFAGMMALALGGGEGPRLRLLVEDRDGALVGAAVRSLLSTPQISTYVETQVVPDASETMLLNEDAAAWVRIPEDATGALLKGEPVVVEIVRNPTQGSLATLAQRGAEVLVDVLNGAARVLAEAGRNGEDPHRALVGAATPELAAIQILLRLPRLAKAAQSVLLPPRVGIETQLVGGEGRPSATGAVASVFLFVLPGISVFALFMLGDLAMRDILNEEAEGTLHRMLSAPVSAWDVVVGKALSAYALCGIGVAVLAFMAWAAAGAEARLGLFFGFSLILILAVTGVSAFVYGFARTQRQGATLSSLAFVAMGFLGGSFVPVESLHPALQKIAPWTIFYWATEGYRKILSGESAWRAVSVEAAVLGLAGGSLLMLGAARLRRRIGRGTVA